MRDIHPDVAQASAEVVKIGPDQRQHHQLDEPASKNADARVEGGGKPGVRVFRRNRGIEQPDHEWQQQKHDQTTGAVQDRQLGSRGQAIGREVR
ncbi:hypothetical protein D3C72_2240150 [compost metagenome]